MQRLHSNEHGTGFDLAPTTVRCDADHYLSAERAVAEHDAVFRTHPIICAHTSELPEIGDFVTAEHLGVPMLVVRQEDSSIKVFVNACRHRGAQITTAESGTGRAVFSCPFHAWSYSRNGALRAISFKPGFDDLRADDLGLLELPSEVRHGLVWAMLHADTEIDVTAHLGAELDAELTAYRLDEFVSERRAVLEAPANWKLVIDGFLEDYHLPYLHASTVGSFFASNLQLFDELGPHGRLVPARRTFSKLDDDARASADLLDHSIVLYLLFPSSILLWQADHFDQWTITPHPTDRHRCQATVRQLAHRDQVLDKKKVWDTNWEILMKTVPLEDWPTAAQIQRSMRSGVVPYVTFGRNEPFLQHFHRGVSSLVDNAMTPTK